MHIQCIRQAQYYIETSKCAISKFLFNGLNPYKPRVHFESTDPDQTPHKVASDQGLHCLPAECSIKF